MIKRVMHELGKVYDFFFKSSYNLDLEQENQLPPLIRKKLVSPQDCSIFPYQCNVITKLIFLNRDHMHLIT